MDFVGLSIIVGEYHNKILRKEVILVKKRIIAFVLAALFVFALIPTVAYAQPVTAQSSSHIVKLDDERITPTSFNIGGNNFFMLRDVAYALSGTPAQFEVTWDASYGLLT